MKAFFQETGCESFFYTWWPTWLSGWTLESNVENENVRYFTAKNTLNYIDVLLALVKTYNYSFHRSIQEKPVNVTAKNEHEIWYRLYGTKKGTQVKKTQI